MARKKRIGRRRPSRRLDHPTDGFSYPCNYGYVPDTMAGDGEEIDAYLVGWPEPMENVDGIVVAVVRRDDDVQDKLVVVPHAGADDWTPDKLRQAVGFWERFFTSRIIMPERHRSD